MPYANILDKKTGQTFKAIDFGGPDIYKVNNTWVYGWSGATSVTFDEKIATLNPYNKTSVLEDRWEIISHQDIGKSSWRVTVKNHSTQEVKTGVYPFNLNGIVYELKDCAPGTWVIASCGGYKIESSWEGKTAEQVYRLKGTGEIIYTFVILSQDLGPYKVNAIAPLRIVSSGSTGFENIDEETENPYETGYVLEKPTLGVEVPIYDFISYPNTCPMSQTWFDATDLVNVISHTSTQQTGIVYHKYKLDFSSVKSHIESYYQSFVQNDTVFPYKTNLVLRGNGTCYIELYSKLKFTTEPFDYGYALHVVTNGYALRFLNTTPELRLKLSTLSYTQLALMINFI